MSSLDTSSSLFALAVLLLLLWTCIPYLFREPAVGGCLISTLAGEPYCAVSAAEGRRQKERGIEGYRGAKTPWRGAEQGGGSRWSCSRPGPGATAGQRTVRWGLADGQLRWIPHMNTA